MSTVVVRSEWTVNQSLFTSSTYKVIKVDRSSSLAIESIGACNSIYVEMLAGNETEPSEIYDMTHCI